MYAQHFGLHQEPFSIAPDPRYLFMSEQHREALAHLLYGVNGGGGFVLLTGEVGAGKTTVCRCFLEQIPKRCNVAYIFNPKLTVIELLRAVCEEFRIPLPAHENGAPLSVKDYVDVLNEFLLKTHAVGQNSVLIIDEAQNLSSDVLEQLRLLTNLETSERKLLQIILIGQPELRDLLARPELEQLAQRVIARFHLEALTEPETMRYIRHRLSVAGQSSTRPFERKAMQRLHKLSRGIPRRINLLADRALLGAYATGHARVNRAIVDKAATEVFGRSELARMALSRYPHTAVLGGGLIAGALIAGVAAMLVGMHGGQEAPRAGASELATLTHAGAPASTSAAVAAAGTAAGNGGATRPDAGSSAAARPGTAAPVSGTAPQQAANPTAAAASAGNPALASRSGSAIRDAVIAARDGTPDPATARSVAPPAALVATAAEPRAATAPAAPAARAASSLAAPRIASLSDERSAWQELARLWNLPPTLEDPCKAANARQVQCFKGTTSLAMLRVLDRPAILTLLDSAERPAYALLTGLTDKSATLHMGASGVSQTVSLVSLSRMWHGEFATMWRSPPGYPGLLSQGASGPAVQHLATQLAAAQGKPPPTGLLAFDATVKSQVDAFQQSHGLKPDGVAGPTTFMLLNRATGVDEPRLAPGA